MESKSLLLHNLSSQYSISNAQRLIYLFPQFYWIVSRPKAIIHTDHELHGTKMRTTTFAPNEHYHICGRGVNKNTLFLDNHDYARFLFLLLYFQSPIPLHNTFWYVNSFIKKKIFCVGTDKLKRIIKDRYINLVSFALMPNHFHILVQNMEEMVISVYMQRILTAYSKYFNAKYNKSGHVFQGPFKVIHIKNNTQLLHISAYIHKNPTEIISEEKVDYEKYDWSSYRDYIDANRWGELLDTKIISEQFKNQNLYKNFVTSSTAKESLF